MISVRLKSCGAAAIILNAGQLRKAWNNAQHPIARYLRPSQMLAPLLRAPIAGCTAEARAQQKICLSALIPTTQEPPPNPYRPVKPDMGKGNAAIWMCVLKTVWLSARATITAFTAIVKASQVGRSGIHAQPTKLAKRLPENQNMGFR